jgi:hypothetical protein
MDRQLALLCNPATSHGLRKTMKSNGRINASEPTVLKIASLRTTASVSTAMR